MSHELFIDADEITELDDSQAPTGKFIPVDGTPFDFRTMHTIGKMYNSDYEQFKKFGTYDHNFVINGTGLREAAVLQSKDCLLYPSLGFVHNFCFVFQSFLAGFA